MGKSTEEIKFPPRFFVALDAKSENKGLISRTTESLDAQTYRNFAFGHDPKGETYDYILYISEGDTLSPDALSCLSNASIENNWPDMLFADEDVMGFDKVHHAQYSKPPFDPITLLSYNCIGRPLAVRREIDESCSDIERNHANGEYQYALFCAAKSDSIVHIGKTLYSRRVHLGDVDFRLGRTFIEVYLKEKRMEGFVAKGMYEGSFRMAAAPKKNPLVAVIIVASGRLAPLRRLLESLEENTVYDKYRIAVVVTTPLEEPLKTYLHLLEKNGAVYVINCNGLNPDLARNAAAKKIQCDAILFMDEQAEIVYAYWLDALLEQLCRNGVAAVSGKLLGENDVLLQEPYKGLTEDKDDKVKNRIVNTIRGVKTLDNRLLLVRRKPFLKAGCFANGNTDAANELYAKLVQAGHFLIYTPFCKVKVHGGDF